MQANSGAMKQWSATVWKGPLPPFPYEVPGAVPVCCVKIQRVQMKKLISYIKTAAAVSLEKYKAAKELKLRPTKNATNTGTVIIKRRMFPDAFFLTRKEQFERGLPWNPTINDDRVFLIRERQENGRGVRAGKFSWGYEQPSQKREFENLDYSKIENDNCIDFWWDQIDVRMFFFEYEMNHHKEQWKKCAAGMWYLQDYIMFFQMLQSLNVDQENLLYTQQRDFTIVGPNSQTDEKIAEAMYAFQTIKFPSVHWWEDMVQDPSHLDAANLHQYYTIQAQTRPEIISDTACHRFSVLSFFFNCRDDGACRHAWEDFLLESLGERFSNFSFELDGRTQLEYFNQPWFQMQFFLELNFRNAIAQLHYRIFDKIDGVRYRQTDTLQEVAKALFNRQTTLLNTRAGCLGPQNVTPGLFFQQKKEHGVNKNNVLKHLILAQLHDELPALDPQLFRYINDKRIPGAELFLRMIGCPNVLALRELAVQNRYLLTNGSSAAKDQKPSERSGLESVLKHFPPGIQTELLYLLKHVETDDSIFSISPVVHSSKKIIVQLPLLTQMIRQTLNVHGHKTSFETPLQMKFYMFTCPTAFASFRELFCTFNMLEHTCTSRPLVFVLFQVSMALRIMQNKNKDDSVLPGSRCNEAMELDGSELKANVEYEFQIQHQHQLKTVLCTIGQSLDTWPARDQNIWTQAYPKEYGWGWTLGTGAIATGQISDEFHGLDLKKQKSTETKLISHNASMTSEEREKWMLLMYARPSAGKVDVQHDDGFVVRQAAENPCNRQKETGRYRDTMMVGVWNAHSLDPNACEFFDVPDTDIFFEKVETKFETGGLVPEFIYFPEYILDIIPKIPDRTLIYVPAVFATKLRTMGQIHDKWYKYEDSFWRMSCVGYRAWAWKRLLVKCIFFDAWTKVMTRAMSLMALYKPLKDSFCKTDDQKSAEDITQTLTFIQSMINSTKNALGEMLYKQNQFKLKLDSSSLSLNCYKTFQILLTVHKKKRLQNMVEGEVVNKKKISWLQVQLLWMKYVIVNMSKMKSLATTRFLKLSACVSSKFNIDQSEITHEQDVVVYGNYLHCTKQIMQMYVKYQNNLFVKFPRTHGVFERADNTLLVGSLDIQDEEFFFATLYDNRKYSVSLPSNRRTAYSNDDLTLLKTECCNLIEFETQKANDNWSLTYNLTAHDSDDTWAFVALTSSTSSQHTYTALVKPFINDCVTTDKQRLNMYTLPDLYTEKSNKVAKCRLLQTQESSDLVNHQILMDLDKADSDLDKQVRLWNELRASTHFIETQKNSPASGPEAQVLQNILKPNSQTIENPLFQNMLDKIRTQIN